ncbi:uncharacterized protein LOC122933714 [Bufo gargarizans]|uniref:uncharacterized protein LOC122932090 n=1 Tax=Bufo gargarizans TaxID=30331 RepID=UPI001CF1C07B|nr:uncharacterized protein LOC122932090 [Bufo gargarizans]XP_044142256.1 uncharacterized protein LOC122932103 [Bufo gargarizans]XP_044144616.1 uncharacterized protein LOC122933714 [Bufo gargarizans]
MSSNTFSYDIETTNSIISQVQFGNDFLQIPAQEWKTRDYTRDLRRLTSLILHCSTLTEYHKNNRIPRGLRSHLRPTLFKDDADFCDRFENIINKCSFDLMLLTIDKARHTIEDLQKQITATEEQLSSILPTEEWTTLKEKTSKQTSEYQKYTEGTKRAKFIRDAEDYRLNRVYRWRDLNPQAGWDNRNHDFSSGQSSSGSESGRINTQRRRHFLGRGQNRYRQGRGDRGEVRGGDPDNRILTRSQIR